MYIKTQSDKHISSHSVCAALCLPRINILVLQRFQLLSVIAEHPVWHVNDRRAAISFYVTQESNERKRSMQDVLCVACLPYLLHSICLYEDMRVVQIIYDESLRLFAIQM
jgi:hypothetical protein